MSKEHDTVTTEQHEPAWRTSSYSGEGEKCVEVAPTSCGAVIRHSKRPDDGTIPFSREAWKLFLDETRSGEPSDNGTAIIERFDDGGVVVTSLREAIELRFNRDEWSAFVSGATANEFDFHDSALVDH